MLGRSPINFVRTMHDYKTTIKMIKEEVKRLNLHLPKKKVTLADIVKDPDVEIETFGGSHTSFRRRDVEALAGIVPERLHDRLRVPIVVVRRMELGRSVYTVAGTKFERNVVRKIVGLSESWNDGHDEELYLYKPHVIELVNRFGSMIVLAFSSPLDEEFK